MRKTVLMVLCVLVAFGQLMAQTRTVSGKVQDANGKPMVGATVTVKGTTLGTQTNTEGAFSIPNVSEKSRVIVISSVGFKTTEVSIASLASGPVQLVEASSDLDEVVVTGYTREKKSQFAGAAAVVSGKVIEMVPVGASSGCFAQLILARNAFIVSNFFFKP